MFGLSWSEIIVIGAVALVVIGPKDLPRVMRAAGMWSRRLRTLAGDFQRHVDDMVRQAELDELKKEAEKAAGLGDVAKEFESSVAAPEFDQAVRHEESAAAATVPPPHLPPEPEHTIGHAPDHAHDDEPAAVHVSHEPKP